MTKNFDDILKQGKEKATGGVTEPRKKWKETINTLMGALHELNGFYGEKQHYIKINPIKCSDCHTVSYSITVRDINNLQRSIKYHRGGWMLKDKGIYYCEKCKQGV